MEIETESSVEKFVIIKLNFDFFLKQQFEIFGFVR